MIEIERSRNGQPLLKLNEHYLSSSVDPISEARKWVEHYRPRCEKADVLFVIGAGSGYHILELAQQFPECYLDVFEVEPQVLKAIETIHEYPSRVRLHAIRSGTDYSRLISTDDLRGPTALLKYLPSFNLHPALYTDVMLFLAGRHPQYLDFYQRVLSTYKHVQKEQGAISIHDMAASIRERSDLLSTEDRVWLLLRELVK